MNEKIYLKDIAGYDEEKEEAKKIIEILKNHEKYESMGAYVPKGLILAGNPGVGKTMLAKAIANESGVPFFEFENNESESEEGTIKSIKELFQKAKEHTPSIVFIDELDELVMTLDYRSDYSRKTTKVLLTEIDGISSSSGVLVIATTNFRPMLPPSLIRSGRMDKRITFDLPSTEDREAIFKLYLTKCNLIDCVDSHKLAIKTPNFTGADIKTLINETIIDCASKNIEKVTLDDFERNISVIMFQDIRKARKNVSNDMTCYHEIGHFVTEYITTGNVASISIEKYGQTMGHVFIEEYTEPEALTRSNLKRQLVTILGGLAGEEVMCNDITSGSRNDLDKARNKINNLMNVGAFGFDKLKPYCEFSRYRDESPVSETRLKNIEDCETELLNEAYSKAKTIIKENKDLVNLLFNELKDKEKLSKQEIIKLLENYKESEMKNEN